MRKLILFLPFLIILASGGLALAAAAAVPSPDVDANAWVRALYTAATAGDWKIVGGLGLLGLVFALRAYGARLIPWLATKSGGLVLGLAVSLAGTLGLALAAGASVNLTTFASALVTAATAAGLWGWLKDRIPAVGAPASSAATAATIAAATKGDQ